MVIPAWFWLWAAWRDKGAIPALRPASAPKRIPAWAWARYALHRAGLKRIPTSGPDLRPARNVLFHAGDELTGVVPSRYRRALSADRNQNWCNAQSVVALKGSTAGVYSWADCRPGEGTDASYAILKVHQLGLNGWYGQAESAAEFDNAMQRAKEMATPFTALIGNLTVLRPDQLALVASGQVHFINELYLNVHPWEVADWRGAQAGIGGNCLACYGSESEGAKYTPLASQPFNKAADSVYTPGMLAQDYAAL